MSRFGAFQRMIRVLIVVLLAAVSFSGYSTLAQSDDARGGEASPTPVDSATSPRASCAAPSGTIAYIPLDEEGERLTDLGIFDPSSGDSSTIKLDGRAIESLAPLFTPNKLLVRLADDKGTLLVDVDRGKSIPLNLPDRVLYLNPAPGLEPWQFSAARGVEFVTDGLDLYLLDTETAALQNIRDLLGETSPTVPLRHLISSDGTRFTVTDFDHTWVGDVSMTPELRQLADGSSVIGARFSPDGDRLVFVRRGESRDESALMVEPADGSSEPSVIATGTFFSAKFMPQGDQILANRIVDFAGAPLMQIVLVDIASGEIELIYALEPNGADMWVDSTGTGVLIATDPGGDAVYTYVNLESNRATDLPELTGHDVFVPVNARYAVAAPPFAAGDGLSDRPGIYSIDIRTGDTSLLAAIDAENFEFASGTSFGMNGESALVTHVQQDDTSMVIIDFPSGVKTVVPNSFGSLSPDGCFVAGSLDADDDESNARSVSIFSTRDGVEQSIGPGTYAVWVG